MQTVLSIVSAVLLLALFFVLVVLALRSGRFGRIQLFFGLGIYLTQVLLYIGATSDGTLHIETVFVSLYDSAKIFFFDFGFPDIVNPLYMQYPVFTVLMSTLAIMGGLFTVFTVLTVLLATLSAKIRCALFFGQSVAVFFGDDDNSIALAQSIKKKNKKTLVLVLGDRELDDGARRGFLHLPYSEKATLPKRRLFRGRHVSFFFVTDDSEQNVARSYKILTETEPSVFARAQFRFYIGAKDDAVKDLFDRANTAGIDIKIFNEPALIAQKAMGDGLYDAVRFLPERAGSEQPFRFLVSGANAIGRAFFQELCVYGQIAPHKTSCIFHDTDMFAQEGSILGDCPSLSDCADVEFCALPPGSVAFYDLVRANLDKLSYIVLCSEDESLNLEVSAQIVKLYSRTCRTAPPILVYCRDENRYAYETEPAKNSSVKLFGRLREVYSEEVIVAGELDNAAQTLHAFYEEAKEAEEAALGKIYKKCSWNSLEIFTQNSNRRAIGGFRLVMHLLGLKSKEEKTRYLKDEETFRSFIGNRLTALAETEHLRWNAVHYMDGWTCIPLQETLETGVKKNVAGKRHVCLVTFEELKLLEEKLKIPYIAYDEENILRIPKIFAKHPEIF